MKTERIQQFKKAFTLYRRGGYSLAYHVCGTKNPETKNLAVREWICTKCKTSHDRDRNAAINIWKVGASTFFGEI